MSEAMKETIEPTPVQVPLMSDTVSRAKIEKLRDEVTAQKEHALAQLHALTGALDGINAALALKEDEVVKDDKKG